ncbi:hypothetical protein NKR23_g2306 [Pleurostoma richardsiae]|uniref:Uncharacterized protein n=1 Tax=Pleurostoma richardsiae TaxID=41990 RepID=A0AA38RXY7_9PEZI|nr:hypothetical protein NKR23_g2306 [Pleurostoma richardsiae]
MPRSPKEHGPSVADIIAAETNADRGPPPLRRHWTPFEMDTVLALLCKGVHRRRGGLLTFATHLNEALAIGYRGQDRDIELEDVEAMLRVVLREKKAAIALIERQPTNHITRTQKRAFARSIPFDGSLREWVSGGRKEREEKAERRNKERGKGKGKEMKRAGAAATERKLDKREAITAPMTTNP